MPILKSLCLFNSVSSVFSMVDFRNKSPPVCRIVRYISFTNLMQISVNQFLLFILMHVSVFSKLFLEAASNAIELNIRYVAFPSIGTCLSRLHVE